MIRRKGLSTRLSLGILLLAAPIFVLSLGILYLQSRYFIHEEANERAVRVLGTTMQRVRNYMATIETATNSNLWLVEENFHPDSLLALSRRIVQLNSHVNGCSISGEPYVFPQCGRYFSVYTANQGDTIISVREPEYEYFEKVWYKAPIAAGKACWVEPFDEYTEGILNPAETIASYCKPIHGKDGRVVGVISTDLSFQKLAQAIKEVDLGYSKSYFMLLGSDGTYFLHPDASLQFTRTIFTDKNPDHEADLIALGYEMTQGKEGTMHVTVNGQYWHVTYKPVPGTDWSLALICLDSEILKGYYRLTLIIIVLIVVGLLVIVMLCYKVVGRTIRPINTLLELTQRIAEGHYDVTVPRSDRNDVIGQLQNSFATMQQSLEEHVGSIRQTAKDTRERNEELVRATQLAEKAVKQKTAFIQDVSHQIRTPLNIILGFASVLREGLASLSGKDREAQQDGLCKEELTNITNMMRHNSAHLNRMVLMLYDSSDTGISEEQAMQKDDMVSPNQIAQECIDYTHFHFPDLPIRFETALPDDLLIKTNHLYLMRTLRELLYNSGKYSDGKHISLSIIETETMIRFTVEDRGPGLPEESHELIFNPFTKVDDLAEGLGLGLPLSKRHARSLGGDLVLDTLYRDGCRFIVEVPKA